MIDQSKLQSFDVESWGSGDLYALQPFRARTGEAWLTSCAMAWFEQDNVLVRTHRQPTQRLLEEWLRWAAETKTYVVCWNGPFDVAWLIALGFRELVYQINWLDGILLQRHVLNAPKYRPMGKLSMGLKQTVEREYPNEAGYGDNANFNPQTEEEWDALVFYNGLDAKHTLTLAWKYLNLLSPQQVRNMLIEARSIPMVAEATVEGIPVNVPAAQKLDVELERTAAAKFVELKLRANVEITEALLRSPKQLRALLFDHWGLLPVKWTDHATDPQPSTDRESLLQLAVQDNRAALVNEYREANNNRTKFVTGVLASCAYNGDGKTRPAARIFGTYTGRMTYSSKTGRGVAEVPSGSPLHRRAGPCWSSTSPGRSSAGWRWRAATRRCWGCAATVKMLTAIWARSARPWTTAPCSAWSSRATPRASRSASWARSGTSACSTAHPLRRWCVWPPSSTR
jgi:DNA polymerase I-like protein with 3'-5' exonuclease and polymerase domains